MTRALAVAAVLGLSLAGANACEFQRSAANKVDQTKVASTTQSKPMSTIPSATLADQGKDTTTTVEKDG